MFLIGPWQEARHVFKGDDRDVERIAESDEARAFFARIDVEHARQDGRLVGDNSHGVPAQARKAHDDVARVILMDLEELPAIDDHTDDLFDVVRFVRVVGDDGIQPLVHAQWVIARQEGRIFHVVLRQIHQQLTD